MRVSTGGSAGESTDRSRMETQRLVQRCFPGDNVAHNVARRASQCTRPAQGAVQSMHPVDGPVHSQHGLTEPISALTSRPSTAIQCTCVGGAVDSPEGAHGETRVGWGAVRVGGVQGGEEGGEHLPVSEVAAGGVHSCVHERALQKLERSGDQFSGDPAARTDDWAALVG